MGVLETFQKYLIIYAQSHRRVSVYVCTPRLAYPHITTKEHCTSVNCSLYTVHCTLHIVHCTLYNVHCNLYKCVQ